jgi:preprotein translocase subunit SecY
VNNLIQSIRNIFAIPDLRKRVGFTFLMLAVYRIGAQIPTPGVNPKLFEELFKQQQGMLGFLDIFSGGALRRLSVFALGIMPYISASIILQLLTVVWPRLEKLSKEGEMGRRKITAYTRYGTVVLAVIQSLGVGIWLQRQSLQMGTPLVTNPGVAFLLMTILTLTTGTAFVMWLGEQITERGIGNGISLIIFAGIVVGLPNAAFGLLRDVMSPSPKFGLITVILLMVFMAAVVAAIIYMERAQRRIPVQYAKRVVGRRVYGGQNTYLPLRLNIGGVIPVIFAASLIQLPATAASMWPNSPIMGSMSRALGSGQPLYNLLFVGCIVFFCYFYTSIIFNPVDTAENMRKYGGFIPGVRPGKKTAEYIDRVLTRITVVGAIYLALVAIIPEFMMGGMKVEPIPGIGPWLDRVLPKFLTEGLGVNFYFGGTSLLIVVGVAMDTVQQIESQLVMRNYDGFLAKGRIRGRRG